MPDRDCRTSVLSFFFVSFSFSLSCSLTTMRRETRADRPVGTAICFVKRRCTHVFVCMCVLAIALVIRKPKRGPSISFRGPSD